jgi:hypothetical protein
MNDNKVAAQLAALPNMEIKDLMALWNNLFSDPPRSKTKSLLIRKIAWRIQELAYGGFSDDVQKKLKTLHQTASNKKHKKHRPPHGTVLEREHDGEIHRVTVLKDGFEYRHCKYKSLTKIATHITGTKWSGPRFFGLKTA